ncbi:hypothetical protein PINS_up008634 [Pythium insidiosum]|nr:hypothetical protein PINS_up008634 [Pythium insidiosum]
MGTAESTESAAMNDQAVDESVRASTADSTEDTTTNENKPECSHYRRGCRVLAECCKEWVGCRLCHDERFPDHKIDRHAIRQMQCLECETIQPCARECSNCGTVVGEYCCLHCNLFDHDGESKKIFHCDDCGICRVGGRENYFHCKTCCGCYPHSLNNKHRCLEGSMHRECAICLEVTFASIEGVNVLPCGHVLHASCFKKYVRFGNVVCPLCQSDIFTPSDYEGGEEEGDDDQDEEDNTEGSEEQSGESDMEDEEEGSEASGESDANDHSDNNDESDNMQAEYDRTREMIWASVVRLAREVEAHHETVTGGTESGADRSDAENRHSES